MTLNSRERMITALNHKEPDMAPLDFGGTLATIITRDANTALRSYLGLPMDDPEAAEIMCNTVRVSEDILQLYKVDTRPVYISDPTAGSFEFKSTNIFEDAYGVTWKKAGPYYDAIDRPLKANIPDELKNAKWEDISDRTIVKGQREKAKLLYENTEFYIIADIPSGKNRFFIEDFPGIKEILKLYENLSSKNIKVKHYI